MSVAAVEMVGSRETVVSVDGPSQELLFTVYGSTDDVEIRAAIEAELQPTIVLASNFFGARTLVIQSYQIRDKGNGVWDGTAKYGLREPRKTGDLILSFDGTGGTAHINVSKETVESYARTDVNTPPVLTTATLASGGTLALVQTYYVVTALRQTETLKSNELSATPSGANRSVVLTWDEVPEADNYRIYRSTTSGAYTTPCKVGSTSDLTFTDLGYVLSAGAPPTSLAILPDPPDFRGAIGVSNDAVEGVDVTIPVFKFTYTWYPAAHLVTPAYVIQLMAATGKTNESDWKGFQAGEVLFLGPSGAPRGFDDWEISFHFIASPNVQGLKVGDIENIIKNGHDYLWVRFKNAIEANSVIKVPEFAYVERVYDPGDFGLLGIGT